jgi:hypothetical protein
MYYGVLQHFKVNPRGFRAKRDAGKLASKYESQLFQTFVLTAAMPDSLPLAPLL